MSILTATNNNYVRHDENNVVASPQPAFRSESMDSIGWTNFTHKDFDGDYVKHDADNNPIDTQQYVKRDVDNNIIVREQYVRRDEDNVPYDGGVLPPLTLIGIGNITAPEGFVVERYGAGQVAGYEGGTPPITVEGQLQSQATPGGAWVGVSGWQAVDTATREIDSSLLNSKLRISTRIQDAVIAPGYLIANSNVSAAVTSKMTQGAKGTLSGIGSVGEILTKTQSLVYGGIPPYEIFLEWRRRLTGSGDSFAKIFKDGKPAVGYDYEVQLEDLGYDIQGTTRWRDSYGYVRVNTTSSVIPITSQPLALVSKGTLDGVGQSGTVLTQTPAVFSGGVPPFIYRYEWVRRVTGETGFFEFGAPDGLQYTIKTSDIGYDIRGRTEIFDAIGNMFSSSSTIPQDVTVTS